MAAPAPTVRTPPSGRRIPEGFRTLVTFGLAPDLELWEKSVKPGGTDGGALIDISTQFNVKYESWYPRTLVKSSDISMQCMYNPNAIDDFEAAVNRPDTITVLFPNGNSRSFYGCMMKYEFGDLKAGEAPMVDVTIGIMNVDSNLVEHGPVLTTVGT